MMTGILKLVGGAAGPYVVGAVAALLLLAIGTASVQTARLDHAKGDLTTARADLKTAKAKLVNPKTRRTWQADFEQAERDLGQCRQNRQTLSDSLDQQNVAVGVWKAEASRQAAAADKARQAALRGRATAEREAGAILAAKPGADACESADALIRGTLQ